MSAENFSVSPHIDPFPKANEGHLLIVDRNFKE